MRMPVAMLGSAAGSVTRTRRPAGPTPDVRAHVVQEAVGAANAVDRVDENRPEGGEGHDVAVHRGAQAEQHERERDQRDGRDRPQELDHDRRGVAKRAGRADEHARRDADRDRQEQALGVGMERRAELARQRARPEALGERGDRGRGRGDRVPEVERPDGHVGGDRHEQDERPAREVDPLHKTPTMPGCHDCDNRAEGLSLAIRVRRDGESRGRPSVGSLGDHSREPLEGDAGPRVRLAHQLLGGRLDHAEQRLVRRDDRRADIAHVLAFALQLGRARADPCRPTATARRPSVRAGSARRGTSAAGFRLLAVPWLHRTSAGAPRETGVSLRLFASYDGSLAAKRRRAPSMPLSSCSPLIVELEAGAGDQVPCRGTHEHLAGGRQRHDARTRRDRRCRGACRRCARPRRCGRPSARRARAAPSRRRSRARTGRRARGRRRRRRHRLRPCRSPRRRTVRARHAAPCCAGRGAPTRPRRRAPAPSRSRRPGR